MNHPEVFLKTVTPKIVIGGNSEIQNWRKPFNKTCGRVTLVKSQAFRLQFYFKKKLLHRFFQRLRLLLRKTCLKKHLLVVGCGCNFCQYISLKMLKQF